MLVGNGGRDLLVGGFGADELQGNGSEGILIAGELAHTADSALMAIMAEWTSCRSYSVRMANLRGTGRGERLNGDVFLVAEGAGATVYDDCAIDRLTGNAGRDWFFANLDSGVLDCLTDLRDSEESDDLDQPD